jgi:tetratricopeptide (TPR) repeat protein
MFFGNAARAVFAALLIAGPAFAIEGDGPLAPPQSPGAPMSAEEMIRKFPDDPRGHILAANAAMRKCDLKAVERDVRTAMALAEKHPMFTNNLRLRASLRRMLASGFAMGGQYAKALEELNGLVKGEPANAEYLYMRAQAFVQLGKLEDALADVSQIIDMNNADFKAWQLRGFTEYKLKRFVEAVVTFTVIKENTEDYPPIILGMRGQAHAANGKYDLAMEDYDAALKLAKEWREQLNSDDIVEQDIRLKKTNAEAARSAEAAAPANAAAIRAKLFEADQKSLLPTNSLRCQ